MGQYLEQFQFFNVCMHVFMCVNLLYKKCIRLYFDLGGGDQEEKLDNQQWDKSTLVNAVQVSLQVVSCLVGWDSELHHI